MLDIFGLWRFFLSWEQEELLNSAKISMGFPFYAEFYAFHYLLMVELLQSSLFPS